MPFYIETEIKESNILNAGIGRFLLEDCKKDTVIRKQKINSQELFKFTDESNFSIIDLDVLRHYAHTSPKDNLEDNSIYLNDPPLYTNHSDNPNVYFIFNEDFKYTLSKFDLKKGDELYQNYNDFKKIEWFENFLNNKNIKSLRQFGEELKR